MWRRGDAGDAATRHGDGGDRDAGDAGVPARSSAQVRPEEIDGKDAMDLEDRDLRVMAVAFSGAREQEIRRGASLDDDDEHCCARPSGNLARWFAISFKRRHQRFPTLRADTVLVRPRDAVA